MSMGTAIGERLVSIGNIVLARGPRSPFDVHARGAPEPLAMAAASNATLLCVQSADGLERP